MSPTKKPAVEKKQRYEAGAGAQMTASEYQDLASFFFKLGESRTAKWLATAAAAGAILGGLHILWLAFLWVYGRLPH